MKTFIRPLLTLAAITAGLSGCAMDTADSSKIAPGFDKTTGAATNNIDRSYTFTRSEAQGRSSFFATFTLSGTWFTTIRLDPPASLAVNDRNVGDSQTMSKEAAVTAGALLPVLSPLFFAASGTNYYLELENQMHLSNIRWTDQTGKVFVDEMHMYSATMQAPTVADRTTSYAAVINGTGADETSSAIRIEQRDAEQHLIIASASSRDRIVTISKEEMAKFSSGPATVSGEYSVKVKLNSVRSGSARGRSVYEIKPITITVR